MDSMPLVEQFGEKAPGATLDECFFVMEFRRGLLGRDNCELGESVGGGLLRLERQVERRVPLFLRCGEKSEAWDANGSQRIEWGGGWNVVSVAQKNSVQAVDYAAGSEGVGESRGSRAEARQLVDKGLCRFPDGGERRLDRNGREAEAGLEPLTGFEANGIAEHEKRNAAFSGDMRDTGKLVWLASGEQDTSSVFGFKGVGAVGLEAAYGNGSTWQVA